MATGITSLDPDDYDEKGRRIAKALGLDWESLTPEQKKSLYRDYAGEQVEIDEDAAMAQALLDQRGGGMMQTGGLHHANWGGTLGALGQNVAGAMMKKSNRERADALRQDKADALEVAGGLAAGAAEQEQANFQMMVDAMNQQNQGQQAVQTGAGSAPPPPAPVQATPHNTMGVLASQQVPAEAPPQPGVMDRTMSAIGGAFNDLMAQGQAAPPTAPQGAPIDTGQRLPGESEEEYRMRMAMASRRGLGLGYGGR